MSSGNESVNVVASDVTSNNPDSIQNPDNLGMDVVNNNSSNINTNTPVPDAQDKQVQPENKEQQTDVAPQLSEIPPAKTRRRRSRIDPISEDDEEELEEEEEPIQENEPRNSRYGLRKRNQTHYNEDSNSGLGDLSPSPIKTNSKMSLSSPSRKTRSSKPKIVSEREEMEIDTNIETESGTRRSSRNRDKKINYLEMQEEGIIGGDENADIDEDFQNEDILENDNSLDADNADNEDNDFLVNESDGEEDGDLELDEKPVTRKPPSRKAKTASPSNTPKRGRGRPPKKGRKAKKAAISNNIAENEAEIENEAEEEQVPEEEYQVPDYIKRAAAGVKEDDVYESPNDEDFKNEEELEEFDDERILESILAVREVPQTSEDTDPNSKTPKTPITPKTPGSPEENQTNPQSLEYLVKYKNKSYLHVEWVPREFIESDQYGKTRLARFHNAFSVESFREIDEFFNPDFLEVDRILDNSKLGKERIFLVKWRSLPYCEATWEFERELLEWKHKIKEFFERKKVPKTLTSRPRPLPSSFLRFTQDEMNAYCKNNNKLRDYQVEGVNWLLFNYINKRNVILADEMGLGKTVQTVLTCEVLKTKYGLCGPFLIVAPLSTINHWQREAENWSTLNTLVFHGSAASRKLICEYEFYYKDARNRKITNNKLFKFNLLITTYEMILAEGNLLSKIPWQYLVIDEGHRLKNKKSKLLGNLANFKAAQKTLLTGTPLQNDLSELWSLLHYIDPVNFKDELAFIGETGQPKDSTEVEKIQKAINPYLLRRQKGDVEKSIPLKEEIIVEVVPTKTQKTYYRAIIDKNRHFLKRGVTQRQNVPNLINILMELRKVCNHPFLINGAEETLTRECKNEQDTNELMITCSSKLVLVDKLLKKLREDKIHKVLIFSQFVMMLNIIEDFLHYRKYPFERLDGTIRGDVRQKAIDRFCDPSQDVFVFLVSTRAGGQGINLTAADTVVIFDSDFNPQNDIQAQARCHRIGQTKEVKVYRLLTKNTKEREMFERASKKLGLDRVILNGANTNTPQTPADEETPETPSADGVAPPAKVKPKTKTGLDLNEINMLLKYGAYSMMKDTGAIEEEEKELLEGDIDSILKKSSTVIRYSELDTEKGLSTFSKAAFVVNKDDMDLDVNDEDFWKKILPDLKNAEGLLSRLSEDDFRSQEEVDDFMNDVVKLVNDKLEELSSTKIRVSSKKVGELTDEQEEDQIFRTLLTRMVYSPKIPEKKRMIVKGWQETIKAREKSRSNKVKQSDEESDDAAGSSISLRIPKSQRSQADEKDAENDENVGENQEVDEDFEPQANIGTKTRIAFGGWYKTEKKKFQAAFLRFGWNRWHAIRKSCGFKHHAVCEIHSLGESFVHTMIKLSEDKASEYAIKIDASEEKEDGKNEEMKDSKEKNEKSQVKEAEKSFKEINVKKKREDIQFLQNLLISKSKEEEKSRFSSVPNTLKINNLEQDDKIEACKKLIFKNPVLGSKATIEIILVSEEGEKDRVVRFSELTDAQIEDDVLKINSPGFSGKFYLVYSTVTPTNAVNSLPNSKNVKKVEESIFKSQIFEVYGFHPAWEEKEWLDHAKRNIGAWTNKLRILHQLSKIFEYFAAVAPVPAPNSEKKANNASKSGNSDAETSEPEHDSEGEDQKQAFYLKAEHIPTSVHDFSGNIPWWNNDCDADLLRGVARYGYGAGESFKKDDDLCLNRYFEQYKEKLTNSRDKAKVDENFPTTALLNKRTNRLIKEVTKGIELKKKLANLSKDSDSSSSSEEESESEESETEVKKKEKRVIHHPRRITTAKFTFSPPPKPGMHKKVVQIEAPLEVDKEKKEKTKKRVIKHHKTTPNSVNNDPKQLTLDAFKIAVAENEKVTEKTASPVKTRKISFLFEDEEMPKTIEIDSEAKENLKKRKFEEIVEKKKVSLENTEKQEENGPEEDSDHNSSFSSEAKKRKIE